MSVPSRSDILGLEYAVRQSLGAASSLLASAREHDDEVSTPRDTASSVPPLGLDRADPLEVREYEDVGEARRGSRPEGVEASPEAALKLVGLIGQGYAVR